MNSILIIGGTSDMGVAAAHTFAQHGFGVILAGRNMDQMEQHCKDIAIRYQVKASCKYVDLLATETHSSFFESFTTMPTIVALFAGYLGDQRSAETDPGEAARIMASNYNGAVSVLLPFAEAFEKQKSSTIIGVSSVAGDRGRAKNYVYGSAKAGFTAFLSGLRNRLWKSGVSVITVKPGFVRSKMTEGMPLPEKLTATPQQTAEDIYRAYVKKKDVLYTKSIWRVIMLIIIHIPEFLFKKKDI